MLYVEGPDWLEPKKALADPAEFVAFWSAEYRYANQRLYDENIGKNLTDERVLSLFAWKNGTGETIAPKKRRSVETNYLPELRRLPTLSSIEDGKTYLEGLQGGAIWGIFWLHLVNPRLFPIFDQHTYRSMAAIIGLSPAEIPKYKGKVVDAYFTQYVPFLRRFNGLDDRTVDKALFAYGRALKRRSKENSDQPTTQFS